MGMPPKLPHLPHPAVDWSKTKRSGHGKEFVEVTCERCREARWCESRDVAGKIREGTFSGYCYRHRGFSVLTGSEVRPQHPSINWSDTVTRRIGRRKECVHVAVTCPQCSLKRYHYPAELAKWATRKGFSGLCKACRPHAQKTQWRELSPGRKVDPRKGYVRIAKYAVPEEHRHIWSALLEERKTRGRACVVLEHRLVMSIALGRALTSSELVDHMDGNKENNDLSNLRLYRRGKNDPGDTCGYGTFYHEWQMALAEVDRLRAELAKYHG